MSPAWAWGVRRSISSVIWPASIRAGSWQPEHHFDFTSAWRPARSWPPRSGSSRAKWSMWASTSGLREVERSRMSLIVAS